MIKPDTISHLERQIKILIEDKLAALFKNALDPQDIRTALLSSVTDYADLNDLSNKQQIPTRYFIHLNPHDHKRILHEYPELISLLSEGLVDLARHQDCILLDEPSISLLPNADVKQRFVMVKASYSEEMSDATQSLGDIENGRFGTNEFLSGEIIIDGSHVPISASIVHIGRHRTTDIILDGIMVSRFHAQIRYYNGAHFLIDLNSQNGTQLNGQPVDKKELRSGDVITIGGIRLIYYCENSANDEINDETQPIIDSA